MDVTLFHGLNVRKLSDGSYALEYFNGETSGNRGDITSDVTFVFKVTAVNDEEVLFTFPDTYTTQAVKDDFLVTYEWLDSFDKLEADARSVFSKLNTIDASVTLSSVFKGEVDSKYPSASVFANFKRKLGEYSWRSDERVTEVEKANTFSLTVGDKKYPLKVNVYPYRDGSKVEYSTKLTHTLFASGKSVPSAAEIDKLHAQIAQIVND
ncbi:hypothetical protein AGMMS50229_21440 [Campylobacterota bacterium]|nr:hypothetical protein AGMMS50229_21440 [Campylobacterota bacterium]